MKSSFKTPNFSHYPLPRSNDEVVKRLSEINTTYDDVECFELISTLPFDLAKTIVHIPYYKEWDVPNTRNHFEVRKLMRDIIPSAIRHLQQTKQDLFTVDADKSVLKAMLWLLRIDTSWVDSNYTVQQLKNLYEVHRFYLV